MLDLKRHDRAAFVCQRGESDQDGAVLEEYCRKRMGQDLKSGAAAAYVLVREGQNTIWGYYTLSATSILAEGLPAEITKRLPRYPLLPATLLGRMAVHRELRGQGFGEHLLMHALDQALGLRRVVGSTGVVVNAISERAKSFYTQYGFLSFAHQPLTLYLLMGTIEQLISTE